jgi:hypothetical protein
VFVILLLVLFVSFASAATSFKLSVEHERAAHRTRRIVVQLDAADHRRINLPPAEWLDYLFTFPNEPASQIDSIILDIGLDTDSAVDPSAVLPPTPDKWIRAWNEQGFEWVGALVRECHKRKLEVFWNHRFSEVDLDSEGRLEMKRLHPLKAEHPDWLVQSWWWQGLWNAAAPGLREFKVRILRELAETYDLDGFQIDFARHVPALPVRRQWELRENVTEFMRMTRVALLNVEAAKNRPILLSARVPRNLEGCKVDGFDVWTWGKERLVDELTLGTRSFDVDIQGYRRAVGDRIRLQPSLDDHHASDGYRFAAIEYLRGVAANWWAQGADAITTFNFAVAPPARAAQVGDSLAPETHEQAYRELGSARTIAALDKVFVIERRGGYPWSEGFFNQNADAPLPAFLPNDGRERNFSIRIANLSSSVRPTLRLVLFGAGSQDRIATALNGKPLADGTIDDTWKDPQIFSPELQPNSGGAGRFTINSHQKLRLIAYQMNSSHITENLKD